VNAVIECVPVRSRPESRSWELEHEGVPRSWVYWGGEVGFGRDTMRLHGPWSYLLFFAWTAPRGMCAVLLMRRAARSESAADVISLLVADGRLTAHHRLHAARAHLLECKQPSKASA
jgi:hypothetical protein